MVETEDRLWGGTVRASSRIPIVFTVCTPEPHQVAREIPSVCTVTSTRRKRYSALDTPPSHWPQDQRLRLRRSGPQCPVRSALFASNADMFYEGSNCLSQNRHGRRFGTERKPDRPRERINGARSAPPGRSERFSKTFFTTKRMEGKRMERGTCISRSTNGLSSVDWVF